MTGDDENAGPVYVPGQDREPEPVEPLSAADEPAAGRTLHVRRSWVLAALGVAAVAVVGVGWLTGGHDPAPTPVAASVPVPSDTAPSVSASTATETRTTTETAVSTSTTTVTATPATVTAAGAAPRTITLPARTVTRTVTVRRQAAPANPWSKP